MFHWLVLLVSVFSAVVSTIVLIRRAEACRNITPRRVYGTGQRKPNGELGTGRND